MGISTQPSNIHESSPEDMQCQGCTLMRQTHSGWNPELVFLTVVFFNSTDLAVVCFTLQLCENPTRDSVCSILGKIS